MDKGIKDNGCCLDLAAHVRDLRRAFLDDHVLATFVAFLDSCEDDQAVVNALLLFLRIFGAFQRLLLSLAFDVVAMNKKYSHGYSHAPKCFAIRCMVCSALSDITRVPAVASMNPASFFMRGPTCTCICSILRPAKSPMFIPILNPVIFIYSFVSAACTRGSTVWKISVISSSVRSR